MLFNIIFLFVFIFAAGYGAAKFVDWFNPPPADAPKNPGITFDKKGLKRLLDLAHWAVTY